MMPVCKLVVCLCLLLLPVGHSFSANNSRKEIKDVSGQRDHSKEQALLDSVLAKAGSGDLKISIALIDSLLKTDYRNSYALYLKGECLILSGRKGALAIIDSLKKLNMKEYADVLDLKVDLLLGDSNFEAKLIRMKARYPQNFEVKLSEWLFRLDRGETEWAKRKLNEISDKIIFRSLPYQAYYLSAINTDYNGAESAAKTAVTKKLFRITKTFSQQKVLHELPGLYSDIYEEELPYAECGPYFGIEMEDSSGNKIKVSLDTGTGGRLFSIHNRALGEKISGGSPFCIEKSIQYRYMTLSQDAFIKPASFKTPSVKNLPLMYFDGSLTSSDGVFSPFAFKNLAISVDPANKNVTLRSKEALKKYLSGLKNKFEEVHYVERFGWIFIPCKVNGSKVMMMVETGSRDVNFNSLAVERYRIPLIKSTTMWKGKEFPVTRPDVSITIGSINYKPKDGFVEDFVMGNNMCGVAGAGDIGPEFLRNYKFTIDPFGKKIILEK